MSITTTAAKRSQSTKPARFLRLIQPFDQDGKNAELSITIKKGNRTDIFRYWLDRIPSDWGMAFLVEKQGDGSRENEEYHVLLDGENGHSCECKGFLRWDHCKHVEGLLALRAQGLL
jgi:hypothetical protein